MTKDNNKKKKNAWKIYLAIFHSNKVPVVFALTEINIQQNKYFKKITK